MSSSDGHADSGDEGSWPVRCRHTAYVERSLLQGAAARSIPGGSQTLGLKCHELPAAPWLVPSGAGGAGGVALLAALCWHWDFDCPEAAAQVLDEMHFFPEFVWLRSVSVAAQAALCGERGCSLRGTGAALWWGCVGFRGSFLLQSTGARGTEPPGMPG